MYPTQYLIIPWFFHINGVKHKLNVEYRYTILHSSNESKILESEKERKSMLGTLTLFFFQRLKVWMFQSFCLLLICIDFFFAGFRGNWILGNPSWQCYTYRVYWATWKQCVRGRNWTKVHGIKIYGWYIQQRTQIEILREKKKSINNTMYSCNWLYLFINWFDMQVYFDSKNSFNLYYT